MSRRGPISNTDRELRTRHNRPPTCAFTPHARPRVAHRYQNYYNQGWTHLAAHQACCSHLLRDLTLLAKWSRACDDLVRRVVVVPFDLGLMIVRRSVLPVPGRGMVHAD